jgi:thiol-disulfide isomerase/thioredoxin
VRAFLVLSFLFLIPLARAQSPCGSHESYPANVEHGTVPHHAEMIGRYAPDVDFVGSDGKEISLSSFRGRPVLIDLWATWCAPCIASLPSLNHIYTEFKGRGLEFISFDQDKVAARATDYLIRHHYQWQNFHDGDRKVAGALQSDVIPLTILLDANGKIVFFDFSGNEADLRRAIELLGPEFASTPLNE